MDIAPEILLRTLSTAQRQLVEIARALSQNAELLIMDEPTSSLTLSETERLMQVVADLRANGVSVVYISHRLDEVERLADRVVVLRDGRNAGELRRGEISRDRMVQLMVGRDLKAFFAEPAETRGNVCLELRGLRTGRYRGTPRFSFSSSRRDSGSRRSYRRGTFRACSDCLWSRRVRGEERFCWMARC